MSVNGKSSRQCNYARKRSSLPAKIAKTQLPAKIAKTQNSCVWYL